MKTMTDAKKVKILTAALEFYADKDSGIWERCMDDNDQGLRRCFITGTCHPREIARRALKKTSVPSTPASTTVFSCPFAPCN